MEYGLHNKEIQSLIFEPKFDIFKKLKNYVQHCYLTEQEYVPKGCEI
jgi:hypothetical protein